MLVNADICRVRPDSFVSFEDGVARLATAAREKGYERPWTAYQVVYGQTGTIGFSTLHDDWQSLGAQAPPATVFEEVLGAEAGRKHFAATNACLDQIESVVAIARDELSHAEPAGPSAPSQTMMLTQLRARPGGQEACEELIRKIAEAIPKVDDPMRFRTFQTLVGDRLSYAIVVPLEGGLGALDQQLPVPELLNQAFGTAEGGLIFRSGREAIESLQTEINLYREDLSNPRER
ncbi:MAG: hypothetical protein ABFS46_01070 [Myxococcota bacterium]